jgi:hypothetical protein
MATPPATTCSRPGASNYLTDCNSVGNPVNGPSIATNGSLFVAAANDYNSANGNSDFGFATSSNARSWTDEGPLGLFGEDPSSAAGDPAVAVDADGTVYYAGISFSYADCSAGGLELARRDPVSGGWTVQRIDANTDSRFQDLPAIALDSAHVFVSWTRFHSCTGEKASPIEVAISDVGPLAGPAVKIVCVPDSKFAQGSSVAADGKGGFWITYEQYESETDPIGEIRLAHWRRGWTAPVVISPPGFQDLPSPLPGFAFRTNSYPSIAMVNGRPNVVWASAVSGVGRVYRWSPTGLATVSGAGGDQFFPGIAATGGPQPGISWSQTDPASGSYDSYVATPGVSLASTAPSLPNDDCFFGGTFVGDRAGATSVGDDLYPIWTDVRDTSPLCSGTAEDTMVLAPEPG